MDLMRFTLIHSLLACLSFIIQLNLLLWSTLVCKSIFNVLYVSVNHLKSTFNCIWFDWNVLLKKYISFKNSLFFCWNFKKSGTIVILSASNASGLLLWRWPTALYRKRFILLRLTALCEQFDRLSVVINICI